MATRYKVREFTHTWTRDYADHGGGLKSGDYVRIAKTPDARELNDFQRCMFEAGLKLDYLATGRVYDHYKLVERSE